jgi:transposase
LKRVVKQVVGIDVAQKELVVCLSKMYEDFTLELYANKAFANKESGFDALTSWVKKMMKDECPVRYVMEATGVYHENLAYSLEGKGFEISIVLPNKISNYFRTLDVKTVTDKTASEAIARFGLERKLDNWKRPKEIFKKLRQITRERDQVIGERTLVKNQLHAEQAEVQPNPQTLSRLKNRIALLDKQEQEISKEIEELVKQDKEVTQSVKRICTIPGIALLTAAIILAETNGFELVRNRRQLASYAGFDVKEKQSGTSVKGKSKISKRGNKYLRKAMHMPALTAIRHDPQFKNIAARLVSKHGVKMKAVVAVQRKLLELAYTLCKTNSDYKQNHKSNEGYIKTAA